MIEFKGGDEVFLKEDYPNLIIYTISSISGDIVRVYSETDNSRYPILGRFVYTRHISDLIPAEFTKTKLWKVLNG